MAAMFCSLTPVACHMYGRFKGSIWSHPVSVSALTAAAAHKVLVPGDLVPGSLVPGVLPPGVLPPGVPLPGDPVVVPEGVPGTEVPGALLNVLNMNDLIVR
jgi:hypothetical protein